MMLYKKLIVLVCLFAFAVNSATAAPRVPEELTDNGLIYCTHASGFSFNPQTADAGTSMNVVTEQIYNKLFEISNTAAAFARWQSDHHSFTPWN